MEPPAAFLTVRPRLRGLVFDMDGLMLDTERLSQRCWQAAAADLGVDFPDALFRQLVGRNLAGIERLVREAAGPALPWAEFARRAAAHYDEALREPPPVKPGVHALLDLADALGLPSTVATSTARCWAERKLRSTGLWDRFPAVTTGDEVARGKPAPDIFLLAAARLGLEPAACLVLEDSPNGVRGAAAAGCAVVMVPDLIAPDDELRALATAVAPDLHAVARWLA